MRLKVAQNRISTWLDQRLFLPDDSPETQALKKRFALYIIPEIPFLAATGILLWIFGMQQVAKAMFLFTLFELAIGISFIIKHRNTNLYALINQYFFVFFSFTAVLIFGGIMNSGGIVLIGMAGVLHSLYFLRPLQIRILFIVYIITIIAEVILQPLLKPIPEITPTANLILFVLHLLVIAVVLQTWLDFFIQQSIQLKMQEAEHLKELDKIKTNFYTNVTHEIRTPLTVILGLSHPAINISNSDFQRNVPIIRKNGIRLLQLVNQMLDLSRLEAKAMNLNLIHSDIISHVQLIIEPFKHLAKEKKIALYFQTQLKELQMDFDPEKIESLLSNLLSNAIKYSPENTEIYCILTEGSPYKNEEFGYSIFPNKKLIDKRHLKLTIKDSGYGIEEKELPLIFDRFYQVSNKYQSNGAGIGLLLVKEIVGLLNGNLFITSKAGAGTEVNVVLPITIKPGTFRMTDTNWPPSPDGRAEAENTKEQIRSIKKGPLLLIIEDNNDVVNYLHRITARSYQTINAENGDCGIEMALKTIPDIIISDVLMPRKNGFEVCDTLKKDFRTNHIPIVLLTAKADKPSQISGYKHGADAYLAKPFDPQELLVRLKNLIENRAKLKAKYKTLALVPDAISENIQNPDEQFLLKARKIVACRFRDDNFDTIELSAQLGMSRTQLFRKLKALTGLSATHFIRFYRLSTAKEMVQKTSLTISEIAYEVGFKDPAYFTRVFASEFGTAPSSLRKKN